MIHLLHRTIIRKTALLTNVSKLLARFRKLRQTFLWN